MKHVLRSGENYLGNLFASSFIWKEENHLPHLRSSKYDACLESRNGTQEPSEVSTGEVLKLPEVDHGTSLGHDVRRGILQCRPHMKSK